MKLIIWTCVCIFKSRLIYRQTAGFGSVDLTVASARNCVAPVITSKIKVENK